MNASKDLLSSSTHIKTNENRYSNMDITNSRFPRRKIFTPSPPAKYTKEKIETPERKWKQFQIKQLPTDKYNLMNTKNVNDAPKQKEHGKSFIKYIGDQKKKQSQNLSSLKSPMNKFNEYKADSSLFTINIYNNQPREEFKNSKKQDKGIQQKIIQQNIKKDFSPINKSQLSNIFKLPEVEPDHIRISRNSAFQSSIKCPQQSSSQSFHFEQPIDLKQDSQDDDDQSIHFTIKQRKQRDTIHKSNLKDNMFALQKILAASSLYNDYLQHIHIKRQINQFVLIQPPEKDLQKLPRQFFFKPQRILFNKRKDDLSLEYSYNHFHIICKVNEERTKLFYQDLKLDQLHNLKNSRCDHILLQKQSNICKNIQYDHINRRIFLFSNTDQKILVFSELTQQLLCSIKVQNKVYDPHLFIHQVNNRNFLMLVGGYTKIDKDLIEGSRNIEVFELKRWQIALKSKFIKLIIGRISPIIMTIKDKNQTKVLILGGNTIAHINGKFTMSYEQWKDINESTNLTGQSIPSQQIVDLFDYDGQAICSNLSVKIANPSCLHDGYIVPIDSTYVMLLPGSKKLFQVKISNKQINIIEGKTYSYLPIIGQFQQRQLCLRTNKDRIVIYRINQQGNFQIITYQDKVKDKCFCLIY